MENHNNMKKVHINPIPINFKIEIGNLHLFGFFVNTHSTFALYVLGKLIYYRDISCLRKYTKIQLSS